VGEDSGSWTGRGHRANQLGEEGVNREGIGFKVQERGRNQQGAIVPPMEKKKLKAYGAGTS